MTIVGGLRARLLTDSLFALVEDGLEILGWLDVDRSHRPVRLQAEPPPRNEPIEPNLVAIQIASIVNEEIEVGSWLTTDTATAYVNVYAESDSFGVDISNDLRDLLRGRLPSDGTGTFPIFDYRQATPPIIGYFNVRDVGALRNVSVSEDSWMRHWFRVRCELEDTYYSTEG